MNFYTATDDNPGANKVRNKFEPGRGTPSVGNFNLTYVRTTRGVVGVKQYIMEIFMYSMAVVFLSSAIFNFCQKKVCYFTYK